MPFSVVILSKNASNLVPCLGAVRKYEPESPVIVLDDGLDWGSDPWPEWDDARNARFLGEKPFVFARNANCGINAACSDDVILLNDDALLQTPGGFSLLAQAATEHPEFGLIAATCNNVGNLNQKPVESNLNQKRIVGGGIYGAGIRGGTCNQLREDPRMVCFVCVYIPRSTIDKVGLLDERFTGYGYDDDDYCLRVRKAGLKIGIHDGCYVDHDSLKSSFRGDPKIGGDLAQNQKIFIDKWGSLGL